MPLAPGTRLGTYVIEAPLGAGGMGEVYRARDTKLDRHVAIKVLAQPFAADGERLARFEREAKTLAALNHPHIAQVHGVIEQPPALVMELVDGEDLAHRLLRGPIPLDDAIPIAQQIADALEAAHERGIIHRDLKPANIKIRPDGTAKVLDFGLAKTLDPLLVDGAADVTNSPTFTSPAMTNVGAILGTAAYMAPEQARGKPIDKRTDIWAFGAVLYEMLTGRPAFTGQTVTDVLAAVVTRDLDWRALPANTPSSVRRLLVRCLERDTKKRLRDIGDARLELDANAVGTVAPPHGERRWGLPVWTLPIAVLTPAAATAVMAFLLWPEPSARPVRRFDLQARGLRADTMRHPVISPDGQRIAWAAAASLWVRDLDRTESRMVARDVDPMHLAWSPDSREVVYFSAKRLWRVRTDGGAPVIVAEAGFPRGGFTPGAVWLPDGRIIFAPAAFESGLLVVPAQGGEFQTLFEPPEGIADFHSPSLLPDNRGVLLVVDRVEGGTDSIQVFADGRLHQLIEAKGERFEGPVYSATGHLLYERQVTKRGLWAVPFSLERLQVSGEPFLVAVDAAWPSVSTDGTLVHTRKIAGVNLELTLVGAANQTTRPIGQPSIAISSPRVSPDGRRIVVTARAENGSRDLYVYNVASGNRTRLTFDADASSPQWARGSHIVFVSRSGNINNVAVVSADGGGAVRVLAKDAAEPSLSADGRWLLFTRSGDKSLVDVLRLGFDANAMVPAPGAVETPVLNGPSVERGPKLHPSGRFMAYESEESGRRELYVTTFPEARGKWQVSTGGMDISNWHPDGNRLLYVQSDRLFEVAITLSPSVTTGTPRMLLDASQFGIMLGQGFDATPTGDALVAVRRHQSENESLGLLSVVEHWFEEFRSRAPAAR